MTAKAIAFLGTGSDVGKSLLTAGFCRILANRGFSVAPFKAQNMSNNSWVTVEGGEIGRAQVVQAQAAYIEPHVDMNPVLLKPSASHNSQVIIHGKVWADTKADEYRDSVTDFCAQKAFESLARLMGYYDYICIEGAGSCAEMNLKLHDFVNFRTVQQARAPVILVADIDKGGVFAKIIGTLSILPEEEKKHIKGILINKFHGEVSFFREGKELLEQRTGLPVLGIIPFDSTISIDAEDSVPLMHILDPAKPPESDHIAIAVIAVPCISNWTDFRILQDIPNVDVHYLSRPRDLQKYDCVIIPGSKGVLSDLAWLKQVGWEEKIRHFGGKIFGMCGGFQILGRKIADPHGTEGPPGEAPGLGYLNTETVFSKQKKLTRVKGFSHFFHGHFYGYEIHMGRTEIYEKRKLLRVHALLDNEEYDEGCVSDDGRVMGTYIHGILDHADFLEHFLDWINTEKALKISCAGLEANRPDAALDKLSRHIGSHVDMDSFFTIIEEGV